MQSARVKPGVASVRTPDIMTILVGFSAGSQPGQRRCASIRLTVTDAQAEQQRFIGNVSNSKGEASTAKQKCLDLLSGPEWNSYIVF